ncbi:hypothetical protein VTO58DRAFT_103871 [Aureobasidium pullulans]
MLPRLLLALVVSTFAIPSACRDVNNTLVARQGWRTNFSLTRGSFGAIGYTFADGADRMQAIMNNCRGYKEGREWTNVDCVFQAIKTASGYALFVLGLGVDSNAMATLIQRAESIATAGAAFAKRQEGLDDLEVFGYIKTNNVTENVVKAPSSMLEGLSEDQLAVFVQMATAGTDSTGNGTLSKRYCPHHNIRSDREWFVFNWNYGIKVQCKAGCDLRHINWNDMYAIMDATTWEMYINNKLNVQYTIYNNANRVVMRCFATLQSNLADSCPEYITGDSCFV